jgi:thioredoxin reductase
MYEVLVVGAGPAGLSAALVLGRCRRRVLVCDSGRPRNAVTAAVHGFLTRDGIAPADMRQLGREQLRPYDTVELRDVAVDDVRPDAGRFVATLRDGSSVSARKLLIATGVVDTLPPVPGLAELYGKSVFHCPYCDGWEVRDRPLAVYGRGSSVVAEARALSRYSDDVIVCTDGEPEFTPHAIECLGAMRVAVRRDRVARLAPRAGGLSVIFADGAVLARAALFFCSELHVRSPLAARLGCAFAGNGLVETLENEATGVPGVYVAGDASRSVLLAIVAAGEGASAAFAINRELLREDLGD